MKHQEEITTEPEEVQEETTEVQERTEDPNNSESQENQESQENPKNPDNQENPGLKDNKNSQKRKDTIIPTNKDPTTSQRIKNKSLNPIQILLLKEKSLWETSKRRKSDNSKMMVSKLSESQNPRPNKDKRNGTKELTEEKFIITTNNKTDWLYI